MNGTQKKAPIVGLCFGAAGFFIFIMLSATAIGRATNSTAAIDYIFLPFFGLFIAAPCFLFGYCSCFVVGCLRRRERLSIRFFGCAFLMVALFVPAAYLLCHEFATAALVRNVKAMNQEEISQFLKTSRFRENEYALNTIALRYNTDADSLYQISQFKSPRLRERIGSLLPIMGGNTMGYSVMRLVARHHNTDARTLAVLAESSDEDLLSDIASNGNAPIALLEKLHKKGNHHIDRVLAFNPRCPTDILHDISLSADEDMRSFAAMNDGIAQEDLQRLSKDSSSKVRRYVLANRNCPGQIRANLRNDPNEQVRNVSRN